MIYPVASLSNLCTMHRFIPDPQLRNKTADILINPGKITVDLWVKTPK